MALVPDPTLTRPGGVDMSGCKTGLTSFGAVKGQGGGVFVRGESVGVARRAGKLVAVGETGVTGLM